MATPLVPPQQVLNTSSAHGDLQPLDLPSLQPLSHGDPLLASHIFDADAFLLSRSHIPLEELRGELREYLAQLKEELVQLINDDYEQFISLGTGLRGEADRLHHLETPLSRLRAEVSSVRDILFKQQEALQNKLADRNALRDEKALLDLLQRLFETLARAEALSKDEDRGRSVSRLASEYTQLVYLMAKAESENCSIVKVIMAVSVYTDDIHHIRANLIQDLSIHFIDALNDQSATQLKQCLRTYDLIQGWPEAENVVAARLRAVCNEIITLDAIAPFQSPVVPHTPHPSSDPFKRARLSESGPLAELFNRLLARLEDFRVLFTVADMFDFDILSKIVWPVTSQAIIDRLGSVIFAAGRPDELHKHHAVVHHFITLLETMAPQWMVVAMRQTSDYTSFERRWQLPVYFQLRWKEIVGNLEAELASTQTESPGWALPQSAAAWKALETCWRDEVFLPGLAPQFWRLSLQIIARYSSWLQASVASIAIDTEDFSQEDKALRLSIAGIQDTRQLQKQCSSLSTIEPLGEHLYLPVIDYEDRIVAVLTRRCSEPLKLLRSIASQLRTAAKTTSPPPSHFIHSVFKPLHSILNANPGVRNDFGPISTRVVDAVFGNYSGILASVKKTEDLLRRHRKGKRPTFSLFAVSTSTDDHEEERFKEQMLVDIRALAADAESLGVKVERLASFRDARDVLEVSDTNDRS